MCIVVALSAGCMVGSVCFNGRQTSRLPDWPLKVCTHVKFALVLQASNEKS